MKEIIKAEIQRLFEAEYAINNIISNILIPINMLLLEKTNNEPIVNINMHKNGYVFVEYFDSWKTYITLNVKIQKSTFKSIKNQIESIFHTNDHKQQQYEFKITHNYPEKILQEQFVENSIPKVQTSHYEKYIFKYENIQLIINF
jgi:hypothetical protein